MDSQHKPAQAFAIVRNYRKLEEKKRKRKGSFNARPVRTAKKTRKLTQTFDSTNRLDEEPEQLGASDIPEQDSREVSKMQVERDELEQCIPVNLTEGELDEESPFTFHQVSGKMSRQLEEALCDQQDQGDDLTI